MLSPTPPPPARLHYGWIVAGVTFLVLLVGAGVRATPGVMIVPWSANSAGAPRPSAGPSPSTSSSTA